MRPRAIVVLCAALLIACASRSTDSPIHLSGPTDGGTAAPPSAVQPIGGEACNARDDDGDGRVDEAAPCALPNATAVCASGGACRVVDCNAGWEDCNWYPEDGCERDLRVDVAHCGECRRACGVSHGTPTCTAGDCQVAACDEGWADCDRSLEHGCETSLRTPTSCGACGVRCSFPNAVAGCPSGSCVLESCLQGWANCDGSLANGCEHRLGTITSCGFCGDACESAPGVAAECIDGQCSVVACSPGRGDCDRDRANGCETALDDSSNCGGCGVVCAPSLTCRLGRCVDAVVSVSVSGSHACVVRYGGRVECWGGNYDGELGNGSTTASDRPTPAASNERFVAVSVGHSTTCAIRDDGALFCWGDGGTGELGDGSGTGSTSPRLVPLTEPVQRVSIGYDHVCAVTNSGVVLCWGRNDQGQLGDGTRFSQTSPTRAGSIADAIDVGAGDRFTCALHRGGTVSCWGRQGLGRLGDGVEAGWVTRPQQVRGLTEVTQLSVGGVHSCALRRDASVWCWGAGRAGQLGQGTAVASAVPVRSLFPAAVAVTAGESSGNELNESDYHTCTRTAGGEVWCAGTDRFIGTRHSDGDPVARATPVRVHGLIDAVAIEAGVTSTCAVRSTGSVDCWGGGLLGGSAVGGRPTAGAVVGLP